MELLLVSLASVLAGFVDAIVGGGGLILVPALFAVFPTTHPATLFGINKSASVWGTAIAARAVQPPGATCPGRPCCRPRPRASPAASSAPGP